MSWTQGGIFLRSSRLTTGHGVTTRAAGSLSHERNRAPLFDGPIAYCRQVLGSEVVVADPDEHPEADALTTNRPGLALLTFSADCLPVLIHDPVHHAVGNAHSSRFGAIEEITLRTLHHMTREYGSRPEDLEVALGPSIGPCCYKLRSGVIDEWQARHDDTEHYIRDGHLNLWTVTRRHLERAGVRPDRIDEARICTQCDSDRFYSYRREGDDAGRFGALIWL